MQEALPELVPRDFNLSFNEENKLIKGDAYIFDVTGPKVSKK